MLKNEPVLRLKDENGSPSELVEVINPELLPLCLLDKCTTKTFLDWISKRNMPDNREGLAEVNERFGKEWKAKNNPNLLSLSDHYWIRKREEKWSKLNFFTNRYSSDVGNMFFAPWKINNSRYGNSPDIVCGGVLKKTWKQKNDKTSYLVKAGSLRARQEPLNEVLVSVFCEKLNKIECVKYELCVEGTVMCSKCDNFITEDTELVPASYIYLHEKRKDTETVFEHLVKMCEYYDIPGAEEYLKWLVFVDVITGNEDRNLGNIAFIRDVNTLKFIGPAPLFDSGNAYWDTSFTSKEGISKCFADSEKKIFDEMKKDVDLSILNDNSYESLIQKYPEISDQHKEELINLINERNETLQGKNKEIKKDDIER